MDLQKDELFRDTAHQATTNYLKDFFVEIWPNFMYMIWSNLMELAEHKEENKCRFCGNPWMDIGCPQHVLFTCPIIQWVSFSSWQQCGPGTATGINVDASDWVAIVRQIAANPVGRQTGNMLKIKLAYMNELLTAHKDSGLLERLQSNRHSPPLLGDGKAIMNDYKTQSKNRFFGDMSVKQERERERARKDKEQERARYFGMEEPS